MRFRDMFDLTVGGLRLPFRTTPSTNGEAVLDTNRVRVKGSAGVASYLLSSLDLNVPGGVPSLDPTGVLPPSVLPPQAGVDSLPGAVFFYSGDPLMLPSSYLVLDGSYYLKMLFPRLAAVYGAMHGRGPSNDYFRVPNLIGQAVSGSANGKSGAIGACHVVSKGSGYANGFQTITFVGGDALTSAQGEATVVSGEVVAIRIISGGNYAGAGAAVPGSNCGITAPVVGGSGLVVQIALRVVSTSARFFIDVANSGVGYGAGTQIRLAGSLVGATAEAVVLDGRIIHVIVTNPGNGDVSAATATIVVGAGTGAVLTPRLSLEPIAMAGDAIGVPFAKQQTNEVGTHTHTTYSNGVDGYTGPSADVGGNANTHETFPNPAPQYMGRRSPTFALLPVVFGQ